ncbi:MAG TPA: PQQ-binding-like beta-propeller repeat protein, partial [Pirellulaceae bacterium]
LSDAIRHAAEPTAADASMALGDLMERAGDIPRAAIHYASALPTFAAREPKDRPADWDAKQTLAQEGVRDPGWLWPNGQLVEDAALNWDADAIRWHSIATVDLLSADGPIQEGRTTLYDSANRQLLILGEFGQTECRVPLSVPNELVNVVGVGSNHARSFGDLFVFGFGSRMVAVSVLPGPEQGRRRVLWQKDVVDASQLASEIAGLATSYHVQQIENPFGPGTTRHVGRGSNLYAAIGPLNPRGFCCMTQAGLECLDPLTGETLWRRRDVKPPCELFGDDEFLFVLPEDKKTAIVYSLANGLIVRKSSKVPDSSRHWMRRGRFVLAFERKTSFFGRQSVDLTWFDAWEQKAVWRRKCASGTRGCLIGFDELALIDATGHLTLVDLSSGSERWSVEVPLTGAVSALEVQRSRDQYLIFANCDTNSDIQQLNRHGIQLRGPTAGGRYHRFSGPILAVERSTGKSLWPHPAQVSQYFLPSWQPNELPVIPLYRSIGRLPRRPLDPNAAPPQRAMLESDLVFLDVRTGAIRGRFDLGPAPPQGLMLQGDPKSDTLAVLTQLGVTKRFRVTDTPLETTEPATLGPVPLDVEAHNAEDGEPDAS